MIGPAPLRVSIVLLAAMAIVFAVGSFDLGFWVDEIPGSGLLPFAAAILLLPALAALAFTRPLPEDEAGFDGRTLFALPLICAHAVIGPYVGLAPATVMLITLWVRFFHRQSWLRAIALALCLVGAITALFKSLVAAPMPLFPGWL